MSTSERSALAYVAVPAQRARATVAVLHAWWGVTEVVAPDREGCRPGGESGIPRQARQLRAAGCEVELHRYPGTGHWFYDWDRPDSYEPRAALQAWQRTVDFLDRHLPP